MSFVICFLSYIVKRLESRKNTMSERRNRPENVARKGLIMCTLRTKIRMEERLRQNFEGVGGLGIRCRIFCLPGCYPKT